MYPNNRGITFREGLDFLSPDRAGGGASVARTPDEVPGTGSGSGAGSLAGVVLLDLARCMQGQFSSPTSRPFGHVFPALF